MKKRYFIIAALFLFNPIISVFDIFPDFIGYLLLMKAFSEASYVYDNACEAQTALKRMAIVSLAKLVSAVILPFTDDTMALVFSFTFAILDIIYGISALRMLFDSVAFIGLRCGEEKNTPYTEKMKKFTVVFFIIRIISSSVPDFFALFLSDPSKEWMYRFRTLFILFFTVIASVFGLIWLVRFIKYINHTLTDAVKEKISVAFSEEMKDRQSVFFSKDFIFAISVMSIAMVFSLDFYIDGIEALSDILLAPILAIAFAFLIKKEYIFVRREEKLLFGALSVHFVASVLNTVFLTRFNEEYQLFSVKFGGDAASLYLPVRIFNAIEAVALVAVTVLVLRLINKYTLARIYENPKFFSEYSVDGFAKEYSQKVGKKSLATVILAVIYGVSSIAYTFVGPYMEAYVVINLLIGAAFLILFILSLSYSNDEIYKKILKYS